MSAGLVGANLPELETLSKNLQGSMKTDLTNILNQMNTSVQQSSSYWVAKYGDQFRTEFATFVHTTLTTLDTNLQNLSTVVGKNAQAISAATGNAL
jgi:hypothetical protein